MAVLSFNQNNQIDDFSFVIVRKDNAALGSIKARDVNYKRNFNGADEVSLKVFKELNNNNQIWDRINDYNDLFVPELGDDGYFEMEVTVNEDTSGVYKTITATSRGESELSHTIIYNYEVNTEEEMENDEDWSAEYHTIFYRNLSEYKNQLDAAEEALESTDPNSDGYAAAVDLYTKASTAYRKMKHVSLLHRVLDKLPNYSIGHVDDTLQQLTEWYQFSWDDKDVYSVLTGDIADQYHVYFDINSKRRTISAYDLYSVCNNDNCDYRLQMKADRNINTRYRGDFHHQCPICGSKDITEGYGKFTKIVVSKDNLSNSAQVSSNKDSLINCLKVSGGDDDFDAAVMNQNPNGSQYIFQFSEENKVEMPPELVSKIDEYNEEYDKYYYGDEDSQKGIYTFSNQQKSKYDALIDFIDGNFKEETTEQYKPLNTKYVGYQSLAALYYNTLDLKAFYEYSMTPDVVTDNTSLDDTMALLTVGNLSPIAVINPKSSTQATVENGILQSAKCIINTSLYDVTISPAMAATWTPASTDTGSGTWRGKLRVQTIEYKGTKYESINTKDTDTLTITVNYDMAKYVEQKIEKLTQRNKAQVKPLTDLTDIDQASLNPDGSVKDNEVDDFKKRLHYYSLDILSKIVYPSYQDSMGIIIENSNRINELYYKLYNNRLKLIEEEIALREKQLADLQDVLDDINYYRSVTKVILDFELFLGDDLYKVFCNYRREDNYKNDNYISDDLDNNELMRRAGDLLDAAQKEVYKLSHLQYNVSGSLNNLLQLPAFAPIKDDFEVGNWINMLVDEKLYNLRLLSYSINFAELQTINVEFSTVEEIWSGATDIQSVLKQAGSMAGSYSAFQQQVRQQAPAAKRVQDWMNAGMDATAVRYVNNPMSQDIVYDSSGIVARGYDEISDSYTDNQLKIINNGLYLTQDNWDTISTGIGAFTYYDPETKEFVDDYGVIANTVVGKLFLGQNLKIYTGDGATDNRMIMDGDGLNVTNGTATVKINPNASNIFEILQGKTAKVKVDSSGNATFTGAVNATSLSTGSKTSAAGASGIYIDSSGNLSAGTSNQVKINANGTFNFGPDLLTYNGSTLSVVGAITANSGYLGTKTNGFTIDSYGIYSGSKGGTTAGYITLSNGNFTRSINGTSHSDLRFAIGANFGVSNTGVVYANSANISGVLKAGANSTIGPWKVTDTSIYKGNSNSFKTSGVSYFGDEGLSITNKFYVTKNGECYVNGSTLILHSDESDYSATELIFEVGNNNVGGITYIENVEGSYGLNVYASEDINMYGYSSATIGSDDYISLEANQVYVRGTALDRTGWEYNDTTLTVQGNINGKLPIQNIYMEKDNISVNANSTFYTEFTPSMSSGYRLLGVSTVQFANASSDGQGSSRIRLMYFNPVNGNSAIRVWGYCDGAAAKVAVRVQLLCATIQ